MLVETDSPYLSPIPYRGKPNEPSYIVHTINRLAEIKKVSKESVMDYTTNNFKNFLTYHNMKSKLIVLGCGNSTGVPRIDGEWGNCNRKNKKNLRTRCSAIVIKGSNNVLIDTSPDIKKQLLDNRIKKITSILYTHEHADQTNGLFELRPFFWKLKKKINIYGNKKLSVY